MEPKRRLQAGVLTAGVVVAVTLAGLGVAGAQTDDSTPTTGPPARQAPPADGEKRPGCHHGHHGRHGPGRLGHHAKAGMDVAATTVGVSLEELRTELRNGRSIADVARSKGVDPQKVIDAMVADPKEHLAEAVKSGRLTQAEADERAARVTERVIAVVNREGLPDRGPGRRRGPRPPARDGGAEPASVAVA